MFQRVGRWVHRFRRNRQMMSDVHPGPDAAFLDRFNGGNNPEEGRRDIGWKEFLCRQHCHGRLVVDTTKKGHYRVRDVKTINLVSHRHILKRFGFLFFLSG